MHIAIEKTDLYYILITALLYFVFLIGFWLVYQVSLKSYWSKVTMHNRLRARRKALNPETKIEKHLRTILNISRKNLWNQSCLSGIQF